MKWVVTVVLAIGMPLGLLLPDPEFLNKAAEFGMKEVEVGRLAVERASNSEVRALARREVTDHSLANDELIGLAKIRNVPLTVDPLAPMRPDIAVTTSPLAALKGPEFDHAFVEQMVKDHVDAIALFEPLAEDSKDKDLKCWAEAKLEALKSHLKLAQELQGKGK